MNTSGLLSRFRPTEVGNLYYPGLRDYDTARQSIIVLQPYDKSLRPILIGKDPDHIEDIWQSIVRQLLLEKRACAVQRDERSGPGTLGHEGETRHLCPSTMVKGGKARMAADCYSHASGSSFSRASGPCQETYARRVSLPPNSSWDTGDGTPTALVPGDLPPLNRSS